MYVGQEAPVRTGHGKTGLFQIGKGVHQGCILSPCLFNLYKQCCVLFITFCQVAHNLTLSTHTDNFDHLIKGDILRLCKYAFPHLTLTHWFSMPNYFHGGCF